MTRTWWSKIPVGLALLAVAYGFASWAIDTGSLWQYALTIVSAVAGLNRLVVGIRQAVKA